MSIRIVPTLLVLLLAAQVPAQEAPVGGARAAAALAASSHQGFEHVLPARTCAFMGIADVDGMWHDASESSWGRLWKDPASDSMRTGMEQQWKALGAMLKEQLGVDPTELVDMVHGSFAVAVTSFPDPSLDTEHDEYGLGAALLADFGDDVDEARLIVEQIIDRAGEKERVARTTETVGDTEVTLLHTEGQDEPESFSVRVAFHGSTLVCVLGALESKDDVMESVLGALDGDDDDVLADVPAFRNSVASQHGGSSVWVDLSQVVTFSLASSLANARRWADDGELVEDADSPIDGVTMTGFFDKLGLLSLGSFALHSTADARGMRMQAHVVMPGKGWVPGLLRTLLSPVATGHAASVAADSRSMTAWHVDFPGLFDEALSIAVESGMLPPDQIASTLAEMEQDLGFSVREDLLTLLDGQVTVVSDDVEASEAFPGSEAAPMNVVAVIGLNDGKAFNGILEDLIRRRGLHAGRQRLEFQGQEIYSLPLPPVTIQYCVLPDALVLSLSSTMLQDVLRHRASTDLPSLANSDSYKAALASLGMRPGVMSYADAAKSAITGMQTVAGAVTPVISALQQDPGFAEMVSFLQALADMRMPPAAVVEKYIRGGSISAVAADENGVTLESYQP